jgi:hypothetical protein
MVQDTRRPPLALGVVSLGAILAALQPGAHAASVSVIGATLRANNPAGPAAVNVQATFLGDATAGLTNELYLDAPTFLGPVFNSKTTLVNTTASLGSFLPETVLFIRNQAYFVPNPGSPASYNYAFFTGSGFLPPNPDQLPHAIFTFDPEDPAAPVTVGFEDQIGGGDLDFDDGVYSFTNVRAGLVGTALIPDLNPIGNVIVVDGGEEYFAAGLGAAFTNAGTIDNGGSVTNYGSFTNTGTFANGGLFLNDLPAALSNQAGALLQNDGTMTLAGELDNQGVATNAGEVFVAGTVTNAAGASFQNLDGGSVQVIGQDATVFNAGTFVNGGVFVGDGSFDNEGVLIHESVHVLQQNRNLRNAGTVQVAPGTAVSVAGTYQQSAGDTQVGGTLGAQDVVIDGGTLGGTGVVEGQVQVGAGGAVAPGNSPGTLRLDGDFTLDGGRIEIEIAALALHDVLDIGGEAVFNGGTIAFDFDYAPVAGDSFVFLTTGEGITGADTLSFSFGGDVGAIGLVAAVVGNDLVLTAVPLPATVWLLAPALAGLAARARRRRPG